MRESDRRGARPSAGSHQRRIPLAVVALFLVLFGVTAFWNSWERDFWSQTELRVAAVVQEMTRSGDWISPHFAGEEFLRQPPLLFWMAASIGRLPGADPRWAFRAPVLIFALLSLGLTYLLGSRLWNRRVGFLAMLVQGSSFLFFSQAAWLDENLIFATHCQAAVAGFAIGYREAASRGRGWIVLGWAMLAGAALTKSLLLAFLMVGGTIVFFLFLENGLASVVTGVPRLLFWPGPVAFLALCAPWHVALYSQHGGLHWIDHLEGMLRVDHEQEYWKVLILLVAGFFPWCLFVLLGIYHAKDRIRRPGERLCLVAALFPLLAVALFPAKRTDVVLLVWPPVALLVAAALLENREQFSLWEGYLKVGSIRLASYLLRVPLCLSVVLLLTVIVDLGAGTHCFAQTVAFCVRIFGTLHEDGVARLEAGLEAQGELLWLIAVMVVLSVAAFLYSRRLLRSLSTQEYGRAGVELACVTLLLFFSTTFLYSDLNQFRSARAFLMEVEETVGESPLAVYGTRRAAFYYYSPPTEPHFGTLQATALVSPVNERLRAYVGRPDQVYLLTVTPAAELLQRDFPSIYSQLRVVKSGLVGWRLRAVLLVNLGEPPKTKDKEDQEEPAQEPKPEPPSDEAPSPPTSDAE